MAFTLFRQCSPDAAAVACVFSGGGRGAVCVGCGVNGFGAGGVRIAGPGNPVPSVMVDASRCVGASRGVCVVAGAEVLWVCIVACTVSVVYVWVVVSCVAATVAWSLTLSPVVLHPGQWKKTHTTITARSVHSMVHQLNPA